MNWPAAHPPLVRRHGDGFTRYWIEGGEVRGRDVAGDGTPEALLEAVPAEFGPPLPRLAADLASGAPDLDAVERAPRNALVPEGRQRHAGPEGLRHEPPAARPARLESESGRRRMSN
ncbi:MAG: hypothetical protein OXD36_16085 [Rhodobacter sp.]|nr:hypothetical protein [Rhodobacter sp.]